MSEFGKQEVSGGKILLLLIRHLILIECRLVDAKQKRF